MAVISRSGLSAVRDKCICNIWRLVEPEKPSCPFVFHIPTIPELYGPEMEASFRSSGLKMVNDHKHQRHPDIIFINRPD